MADLMRVASNHTCGNCSRNQADFFCTCVLPPVSLCKICIECHESMYPAIEHPRVSIGAMEKLEEGKRALRRSVELMAECGKEVALSVDQAVQCLTQYKDWWTEFIRTEREKAIVRIDAATEEAEYCVLRNAAPTLPLAKALCTLSAQELLVFQYTVKPPDLEVLYQTWVTYSLSLETLVDRFSNPIPQPQPSFSHSLASVKSDKIRLFSVPRMTWLAFPLASPISVDHGSRYVWVEEGLFCSGGRDYTGWNERESGRREAYILSEAEEWGVRRLADMLEVRWYHGLWWLKGQQTVFVFGGKQAI